MDVYKISITDTVKQDIRDVGRHIADELQKPAIAEKAIYTVLGAIDTLDQMPDRISTVIRYE